MRTQVTLEEIVGKRIEASVCCPRYPSSWLLVFTDGTFCEIGIDFGYEVGDSTITNGEFYRSAYPDGVMVMFGFSTE